MLQVRLTSQIAYSFAALLLLSACKNPFLSSNESSSGLPSSLGSSKGGLHGLFSREESGLPAGSLKLGPESTDGRIVVTLPSDRCQAGTIVFGNTKCQAVGRGLTSDHKVDNRYLQGFHSNGKPCWYLNTPYQNGATPKGTYSLGKVRSMGNDKQHWGQAGISLNDNVPGRGGFVIHSVRGFYENTPAEVQNGFGCIRISQECLAKLHRHRQTGMPVEVVEVGENKSETGKKTK